MTGAPTPLDRAHQRAEKTGETADRLAFWERFAEAELSLLLSGPPEGQRVHPRLFDLDGTNHALAFDRADRLAAFAGEAPTATLSGRALARLLAREGLGLGLNLEEAPSAQLIAPEAMAWLAETTAQAPVEDAARIEEVGPPGALPDRLLVALDAKLPTMAGLARTAYLAGVRYEGGSRGHVLAFVDPVPGAEGDLARAVNEALVFSGLEAGALDVTAVRAAQPIAASLARHGLRIEIAMPKDAPARPADGPPRLR